MCGTSIETVAQEKNMLVLHCAIQETRSTKNSVELLVKQDSVPYLIQFSL